MVEIAKIPCCGGQRMKVVVESKKIKPFACNWFVIQPIPPVLPPLAIELYTGCSNKIRFLEIPFKGIKNFFRKKCLLISNSK